jgi:hypothetical protein
MRSRDLMTNATCTRLQIEGNLLGVAVRDRGHVIVTKSMVRDNKMHDSFVEGGEGTEGAGQIDGIKRKGPEVEALDLDAYAQVMSRRAAKEEAAKYRRRRRREGLGKGGGDEEEEEEEGLESEVVGDEEVLDSMDSGN